MIRSEDIATKRAFNEQEVTKKYSAFIGHAKQKKSRLREKD